MLKRGPATGIQHHASLRWAKAVAAATDSPMDLRTLAAWGHAIGASRGAIRAWCHAAGESPHASLDLTRMLRAVILSQAEGWDPWNLFDIVDERTMRVFLRRCRVSLSDNHPPTVKAFLGEQRLISCAVNLRTLSTKFGV